MPSAVFHDVTVAPKRFTVTESWEGRLAIRTLSVRSTVACGRDGDTGIADGLFLRSILALELRVGSGQTQDLLQRSSVVSDRSFGQ